MVFHIGLISAFLLTLASALTINQERRIDNCGFELTATCEEKMTLKVDGNIMAESDEWRRTKSVRIPPNTRNIEISCRDGWIHGGIIASGDNGLKTDDSWSCSFDDGSTWSRAFTFGKNGQTLRDIDSDAEWIWTGMQHWNHGNNQHTNAKCKIDLGASTCSTPTTVSPPNSGFGLYATCYEKMTLFVDGTRLPFNEASDNWEETKKVHIGADAKELQIHCEHGWNNRGGILASTDNGLKTDGTWNCSSDGGTTWNSAFEINPDSTKPSEISSNAKWIWNEKDTCNSPGSNQNNKIICKTNLDGSVHTPVKTLTVLPSNAEIITSNNKQEHCCVIRSFDNVYYNVDGVFKEDIVGERIGCLDNCIYKGFQDSHNVCITSEGSECKLASHQYKKYSQDATENREKFETILDLKTNQYGQMNQMKLTEKLDLIKADIEKHAKRSVTRMSLPKEVHHYIGKVTDIFNKHDNHEHLENELNSIKNNLQHESHSDDKLHEVSHSLIESTRLVSKISKTEDNGGNDGIEKFWDAVVANTDAETARSIRSRVKRSGCDGSVLTNTLTGTATGCLAGPEGCAAGAITAGVGGLVSCVPDVVGAVSSGCFAAESLVETRSGTKKISELLIGDFIKTSSPADGFRPHFTEFLGWLDRMKSSQVEMLQVSTSQLQSTLTLTASHIVFTGHGTKYADDLILGDFLMYWNGTHNVPQEVTDIRKTYESGFWAPLTSDGTLLVNGYLASCYASFPHQIADIAMTLVKAMPRVLLENEESQHKDGVRSVVKVIKKAGEWIGSRKTKKRTNQQIKLSADIANQFISFTPKN